MIMNNITVQAFIGFCVSMQYSLQRSNVQIIYYLANWPSIANAQPANKL